MAPEAAGEDSRPGELPPLQEDVRFAVRWAGIDRDGLCRVASWYGGGLMEGDGGFC